KVLKHRVLRTAVSRRRKLGNPSSPRGARPMAGDREPWGSGKYRQALLVDPYGPAAVVDDSMVVTTQEDQVRQRGIPSVRPVLHVMRLGVALIRRTAIGRSLRIR